MMYKAFPGFLALALLTAAPMADAQTNSERAGARAAAGEGLKAFNEGRHAEAIDLFTRAESLVHAPPHLLYIARANEKLGWLVLTGKIIQIGLPFLGHSDAVPTFFCSQNFNLIGWNERDSIKMIL